MTGSGCRQEDGMTKKGNMSDETTKLRTRLDQFTLILDKLDHPTWRRDEKLDIVYCNLAHAKMLEDRADEIIGPEAMELTSAGRELAQSATSTGKAQVIRKHLVVSGERRLFEITETPVKGGTVGYAIDISDVEETRYKLEQHIAVQNDLMASSATAIAIYSADMRLKFYNRAFLQLWKLDEAFLKKQPTYAEVLDALREKKLLPEQSNFKAFKKTNLELFTTLREKHEEHYYLPDERVLKTVIIPHELGGLLFSYEDMTDHITLERSYNTLISVKAHTLDNLFEGVAAFGENGKLQLSNPAFARMWGLDRTELLKNRPHISDILEQTKHFYHYHGSWEEFKKWLTAQIAARTATREPLERTDGTTLEWARIPLPDGASLLTFIDITDSRRVEQSLRAEKEALQTADRLKNSFLSNVSYEFRSPLTSIKGFTEILLAGMFGDVNAKQREYLEDILASSENLAVLIDDIMDAASMEAGYMKLKRKPFDLQNELGQLIQSLQPSLEKKHIALSFDSPGSLGLFDGDRERLMHAIGNLLRNAAALMENGGSLTLSAQISGDAIRISIKDKGATHPLPKEKWDTGLELTIARRFIELHGGDIHIETGVASGTHILCSLPV